jgi:hypothetical protein
LHFLRNAGSFVLTVSAYCRASILRKAGSVADIKANQVSANNASRGKLKRTSSSVGAEASRESILLAEQEVAKAQSSIRRRSSKHKSLRTGAVDRNDTYDELYEANKLVKVPGYCLETILDVPDQDMLDHDYCKEEIEYADFLKSNFCNRGPSSPFAFWFLIHALAPRKICAFRPATRVNFFFAFSVPLSIYTVACFCPKFSASRTPGPSD